MSDNEWKITGPDGKKYEMVEKWDMTNNPGEYQLHVRPIPIVRIKCQYSGACGKSTCPFPFDTVESCTIEINGSLVEDD